MRHHVLMNKRLLSTATFYSAAVMLATYLADGQSAGHHVFYLSTTVIATHMSQRRSAPTAVVSRLPDTADSPQADMVAVMSHVEDMLSHAS